MSLFALPSLVVTYGGTRLIDRGMVSNFLTTSTLGNIVVSKCVPQELVAAGNSTAGTQTCGQEVCIKRPAHIDTIDGNLPLLVGAIVGAILALAVGAVFGEDVTPCKTIKAFRIISAIVCGALFAVVAVPFSGYFACVSSTQCVTSISCFPATQVFYIIAASDWVNVIIFLTFTLYFLNGVSKIRKLVDDTHVTARCVSLSLSLSVFLSSTRMCVLSLCSLFPSPLSPLLTSPTPRFPSLSLSLSLSLSHFPSLFPPFEATIRSK